MRPGLRLRHEIRREIAPCLGVTWNRRYGRTAEPARTRGEAADETAIVTGLRPWF